MKLIKKILAGAAIALAFGSAQATPVNVGGVYWDTDSPFDFNAYSLTERQTIAPDGSVSGYGSITTFNNSTNFCSGCQLTFQFSGFKPTVFGASPTTPGQTIGYSGGVVNVYVSFAPSTIILGDPSSLNQTNTGLGTLFLGLTGHSYAGTTFNGTVNGNGTQLSGLSGTGQLDATSGLALKYFDTNTQIDKSDIIFSNSFTQFLTPNNPADSFGTGNFHGDTVAVPEPSSLALFSIALLGAAFVRRRKQ